MRRPQSLRGKYLFAVGLASILVLIDFVTKRWAEKEFADGGVQIIGDFFGFTFVENPGGAFSLFPGGGRVIAIAAIVITVGVLWIIKNAKTNLELVIYALVLTGAVGNLIDRFLNGPGIIDGPVIDWIILGRIPTFNVADMAITFAVTLLLVQAWIIRSD